MRTRDAQALVAELQAMIPTGYGQRPWYQRLTPEQSEQVEVMRNAWDAGELGLYRRRAAKAIATKLQSMGVKVGEQGVETWLKLPRS